MDTASHAPASLPNQRSNSDHARRLATAGLWIIIGALLPILLWVAYAPLSMAVVAPAHVKVDLNRRPVQHLEGGIVREVLVRDGQHVRAGEPVLILGDVRVDADRNRLEYRANTERAEIARLEAEQMRADRISFPADLLETAREDKRVSDALLKESALFEARRTAFDSEITLLRAQRERIVQESASLQAQVVQMEKALLLQQKDLETNRKLLEDGFISENRLAQIESGVADYSARLEERRSELSRAAQRMLEIDLKIKSIENAYMQNASDSLREVTARLAEIEQEARKTVDAAARQIVLAPATGQVIGLQVTSPGAVIRPGDIIAEIVPDEAQLLIEARIRPEEIDHVQVDQYARVKITSFKYRNTSMLAGKVSYVSADRLVDRSSNIPYFSVMIHVDAKSLESEKDLTLQAGMPAEVYIQGATRTPWEYIADPITSVIRRAGKEM